MARLDQGYKIAYFLILFLMFLHIYFVIFFTECKIRTSSKFHSKRWINETNGPLFDGILYLEEKKLEESCSENYTNYTLLAWPGINEGVFLNNIEYDYPCKYSTNNLGFNRTEFKIGSIYSLGIGSGDLIAEYEINTPFSEQCYNNNKNNKCYCPKNIVSYQEFIGNGFIIPNKNDTLNIRRLIKKIEKVDNMNISVIDGKKLCMKKVYNFTSLFNKLNRTCENGVLCGNLCIFGEKKCPNLNQIDLISNENNKNKKIQQKLISSLDFSYNGIECSMINRNTMHKMYKDNPNESKYVLSKFNNTNFKNKKLFSCFYNETHAEKEEDIIVLSENSLEKFYKRTDIDFYINNIEEYKNYIGKEDKLYLTATSFFDFNITENSSCSNNTLKEIKFSFDSARKISLINVGNIFILEFAFIFILCYLCYRHFVILSIRTQPQFKFIYTKYFIILTLGFFFANFFIYNTNVEYKENINKSIEYLDKIVINKCFINEEYLKHLRKLKKRLEDFSLLNYSIYENLLYENITFILIAILIVTSKINLKDLWKMTYKEY